MGGSYSDEGVLFHGSHKSLDGELLALIARFDRELKSLLETGEKDRWFITVSKTETKGGIYALVHIPLMSWSKLSIQEKRVSILIRRGLTNKEIAVKLDLAICTVNELIRRIFGKLAIDSRVVLAIESLVETEKEIRDL